MEDPVVVVLVAVPGDCMGAVAALVVGQDLGLAVGRWLAEAGLVEERNPVRHHRHHRHLQLQQC